MARLSHSDHVLQQLNNQREWGFLCDCLIAIGDFYFRAHKAVLAACSSYFRMMFIRDQQGATRLDLSNVQISAECFDLILQLMYLGRIAVGSYEFQELKASMSYLQMYYIPDSLDDLRDLRSSALSPSSSSSTSTAAVGGKMMFGVRMFEQQRLSAPEAESVAKVVSSSAARPAPTKQAEEATPSLVAALPLMDSGGEQPCDLRKRSSGRSSALKERPRFGRTFTCDDCGFVFSCEKLLIEHILTCTNRKALPPPLPHAHDHDDSSKAESSASDSAEEHRADWLEAKDHLDIQSVAAGTDGEAAPTLSIKTEPEEEGAPEEGGALEADSHQSKDSLWDYDPGPGRSGLDYEGRTASSSDSGVPAKLRRLKEEAGVPCELCGVELSEDRSAHYLSNHMSHMCACGRCGQVLIKGRQLLEHAERCGDTHESDSHGEDDASLGEEPQGPEGSELSCPHCGLLLQSDGAALEHALTCPDHDPFRPAPTEDEPDHRRKHFCSICGKGFFQRCHLREHYTVHTKEKQFSCSTCGKQFLRERQLRLHTDMHRGMARYVCPVCDQGTFLKHDHVRHMISHLSPGETICQVCFQIFPSGEQLEAHMDVHLYICGVCGEKFRLRKDMRSHYNNTHTRRL
ncbi:zinc finger and BTB domain-containing protein 1 [Gouania willdenowi]|uniref:Zinc finger and BTB domain containing 1 n=1 Tax=Gouania willdenowi TaxID=441366 RepID=A0A8C5GXP6_GOUWI|nr:zinc finger and BTB domain-containing protein 1 [Gouania willdenowi]